MSNPILSHYADIVCGPVPGFGDPDAELLLVGLAELFVETMEA